VTAIYNLLAAAPDPVLDWDRPACWQNAQTSSASVDGADQVAASHSLQIPRRVNFGALFADILSNWAMSLTDFIQELQAMNTQEIQGHWDTIRGKAKERWGQLTDDEFRMAEGNVDQLIGTIQQRTGETRQSIEEFLNNVLPQGTVARLRDSAREYAQSAQQSMRQGYDQARQYMQEGYGRAEHMVQERPAQSMAAVFALGLITGVIVGMVLRSD
jgi:uncharacterized protein YjbJ (UPF0337 family)